MTPRHIIPIVEGHAECASVPVLLRRILNSLKVYHLGVGRPVRVPRLQVVRPDELERRVALAQRVRPHCAGLLVLLDADDDHPGDLRDALLGRASAATDLPVAVVVAVREFEAWFLAGKESLRRTRGIRPDAVAPIQPERIRGAKEELSRNMEDRTYLEVDDQPALADALDLDMAAKRCTSFRELLAAVRRLADQVSR